MVNRVTIVSRPLRVALLSYRSKAHCGGQGVYVRHLSRELAALGHTVEVLSGQPYPELEPGPLLRRVPSLDLYRDEDPFRTPRWDEYRDWIDVLETVTMWTGAFPEPLTFSLRALRELRARRASFDVVHDNQGLGYGLLGVPRLGLPLVTSIHHPISVDRRIELAATRGLTRLSRRRWYSFVRMQARVARQAAKAGPVITVSESSRRDIYRDFGLRPGSVDIIPLGVDTRVFRPRGPGATARVPGRIVTVASADSPVKGVAVLLRAVAKVATERDVQLTVVGKPCPARGDRAAGRRALAGRRGSGSPPACQKPSLAALLGQRGDRRRAVAVRGLLAPGGRAHGLGHPAGGQPRGRAARGHRGRRRAGDAGRPGGAGGGAAAAA